MRLVWTWSGKRNSLAGLPRSLINSRPSNPFGSWAQAATIRLALDVAARTGELRSAGFRDVEHRLFEQEVTFTPERLSALYGTFSRVRMAPEETRARLLSEAENVARETFGGAVARTVTCSAFVGRRP